MGINESHKSDAGYGVVYLYDSYMLFNKYSQEEVATKYSKALSYFGLYVNEDIKRRFEDCIGSTILITFSDIHANRIVVMFESEYDNKPHLGGCM